MISDFKADFKTRTRNTLMNPKAWLLIGILFASLTLFGCVQQSEVVKVTLTPSPTPAGTVAASPTPSPTPEIITTKTADVGETLANPKFSITVNSVRFTKTIDEQNNPILTANASSGKTFVIVDLTIQSTGNEAEPVSTAAQTKLRDLDGYTYSFSFNTIMLAKAFKDGTLQPGDKSRGEIAYEVPENAKGLQFIFDFGILDLAQAKFNLGDARTA